MPDGLDNVRQLARRLRGDDIDPRVEAGDDLDARFEAAKTTIANAAGEIERSAQELRASVTELHREPTAALELTEDELRGAIEALAYTDVRNRYLTDEQCSARDKFSQALAIESQPGGYFWDGGEAA